ncbi:unnamed protein product [Pleuronectes platessa]|uniref:Uncharacterized protein n=1 Tax=Pleuronectes platessa TaxID=8262 RepID=A0A9N7Y9X4_PLEPL|nr:unnamed protein product [Pleuronectes platessa]
MFMGLQGGAVSRYEQAVPLPVHTELQALMEGSFFIFKQKSREEEDGDITQLFQMLNMGRSRLTLAWVNILHVQTRTLKPPGGGSGSVGLARNKATSPSIAALH